MVDGDVSVPHRQETRRVETEPKTCRLRVRRDECTGCAACTSVCHALALRMDALELELDERLCNNCSVCILVCPVGALYLQ